MSDADFSMGEGWAYHANNPQISADRHEATTRLRLGAEINSRAKVYLDQNYWIDLMHAGAGGGSQVHVELLEVLTEKVASGKVVCPAGETVVAELMKNSKAASRIETAEIVQRLSLGASIREASERANIELAFALNSSAQQGDLRPGDLMWTKLTYALGHRRPLPQGPFSAADKLIMQKEFFDFLWQVPFAKMIDLVGHDDGLSKIYDERAALIRAGGIEHAAELKSFADAFEAEANGIPWTFDDEDIISGVVQLSSASNQPVPRLSGQEWDRIIAMIRRVVGQAICMKRPSAVENFRSLLVWTFLHATVRMDLKNDPNMSFVGNDLFDFDHAAAAVGYCDYFFTERRLYRRLTRPEVALDKIYSCKMAFQPEEALKLAKAI